MVLLLQKKIELSECEPSQQELGVTVDVWFVPSCFLGLFLVQKAAKSQSPGKSLLKFQK